MAFVIVKENSKVFGGYGPTLNDTIWQKLDHDVFRPTIFRMEAEAKLQRDCLERGLEPCEVWPIQRIL